MRPYPWHTSFAIWHMEDQCRASTMDPMRTKRSWRTEFNTPKNGAYTVTSYQETTKTRQGEDIPF